MTTGDHDQTDQFEHEDPLAPAIGLFNGCLLGLICYGIVIGGAVLLTWGR